MLNKSISVMLLMTQMVKNLPARLETWVWSLGWEYPLEKGMSNPLQCSYLKSPHGQRSLVGYSPWGPKESDMTEWLRTGKQTQVTHHHPADLLLPCHHFSEWTGFWTFYFTLRLDLSWHRIKQRCLKFLKPALTTRVFSITDDNYYLTHLNQILIKLGEYATQHRRRDNDLCCVSSWARTNPSLLSRWTKKCKRVCHILFFHFLHSPELHSHSLRKGLMN